MPTPSSETTATRRVVCFSFAAYAKSVISHLGSLGVPVSPGLSDAELAALESALRLNFPPDLRAILREGLPVAPGFPNWRASSPHQLQILVAFPVTSILNHLSKEDAAASNLWPRSFGLRPAKALDCVAKARSILDKAPALVPIYRNFYIPSYPVLNGNPVFYVKGDTLKRAALDLADFFQRFALDGGVAAEARVPMQAPAWAAKTARRVEVWSDMADEAAAEEGEADTRRERRVREMGWRLREGGWKEEEVREMMLTGDGDDERGRRRADRMLLRDRESVLWHVRLLALALLRGGWSTEDVVYCMGSPAEDEERMRKKVTWQVDPVRNEISMEL